MKKKDLWLFKYGFVIYKGGHCYRGSLKNWWQIFNISDEKIRKSNPQCINDHSIIIILNEKIGMKIDRTGKMISQSRPPRVKYIRSIQADLNIDRLI